MEDIVIKLGFVLFMAALIAVNWRADLAHAVWRIGYPVSTGGCAPVAPASCQYDVADRARVYRSQGRSEVESVIAGVLFFVIAMYLLMSNWSDDVRS